MKSLLPVPAAALAALLIPASPLTAQSLPQAGFSAGPAFAHGSGSQGWSRHGSRTDGWQRDRHGRPDRDRRNRRDDAVFAGGWGYYGYDINRSWAPDSYNDWWHDRPDCAYPRWMQNNQDCQRIWWSGGGWRC
jgi:hypothetical protein